MVPKTKKRKSHSKTKSKKRKTSSRKKKGQKKQKISRYTWISVILCSGLAVSLGLAALLIYLGLTLSVSYSLVLFYSGIGMIAIAAILGIIAGIRERRKYGGHGEGP
jgi:Flp pilus assembly protein TadB